MKTILVVHRHNRKQDHYANSFIDTISKSEGEGKIEPITDCLVATNTLPPCEGRSLRYKT